MGRQAYLTRLALGRSPFEAPELTESGEFVLGPRAHDYDNQADGYVQQFDEGGRPENPIAMAAAKELRDAENAVQAVAGVVRVKEKHKSAMQKKHDKNRLAAVVRENSCGPWLTSFDFAIGLASMWWLVSLRRRIQTFNSYSNIPLIEIVKSETRHVGLLAFSLSGLSLWLLALPPVLCMGALVEVAIEQGMRKIWRRKNKNASRTSRDITVKILCKSVDSLILAFIAPLMMLSDLQMLHLIPQAATPTLGSLIPFTLTSPLRLPITPDFISMASRSQLGTVVLMSPLCTGWCYEKIRSLVESTIEWIIRATVPRPGVADPLSTQASAEYENDESYLVDVDHTGEVGRSRVSWTMAEACTIQIEHLGDWIEGCLAIFKPRPDKPTLRQEGYIYHRSQQLEHARMSTSGMFNGDMRVPIRQAAARQAWYEMGFDPPADIDGWLEMNPIRIPSRTPSPTSTATPEPEELFTMNDFEAAGTERSLTLQALARASVPAREANSALLNRVTAVMLDRANATEINASQGSVNERFPLFAQPGGPGRESISDVTAESTSAITRLNTDMVGARNNMILPPESTVDGTMRGEPRVPIEVPSTTFHDVAVQTTHPPPSPTAEDPDTNITEQPTSPHLQSPRVELPPSSLQLDWVVSPLTVAPFPRSNQVELAAAVDDVDTGVEATNMNLRPREPLQRARRLTEDDGWADDLDWGRHWDAPTPLSGPPPPKHHATNVSNFPADAFATHASALITTALLLPLESLYLRSLARGFLASPSVRPGAATAAIGIGRDVRALGDWFGGPGGGVMGRMRYAGVMVLLLGMQGLIGVGVWSLGTSLAVGIGRRVCGWAWRGRGRKKERERIVEAEGWLD